MYNLNNLIEEFIISHHKHLDGLELEINKQIPINGCICIRMYINRKRIYGTFDSFGVFIEFEENPYGNNIPDYEYSEKMVFKTDKDLRFYIQKYLDDDYAIRKIRMVNMDKELLKDIKPEKTVLMDVNEDDKLAISVE